MGKDKKKQLKQLLAFVKELYEHPDNGEFVAGIREMVLNDKDYTGPRPSTAEDVASGDAHLTRIEKYLSLDYDLDGIELPNYSFVKEETARERLNADYREMLRYRFGTRGHKIDFPEYCRFATLQFEMLTNYYYERKYDSDVQKLARAIVADNPKYNPGDYLTRISEIPLKTKVYRFRHEFQWDFSSLTPILNSLEVRNRQSHRSLRVEKDRILEYENRLKAGKVWNNGARSPMYGKAVEQGVLTQEEMNDYSFQVWYDAHPFEEVAGAVRNLAGTIARSI